MVGDGARHPQPGPSRNRFDGHLRCRYALWDLKAKLLNVPLVRLFGQVHDGIDVYGSGGFTSYSDRQLSDQLVAGSSRNSAE